MSVAMPKVLIADELSPKALEIFRSRGIEVDVRVGLKKAELLKIIGDYDAPRGALRHQGRQGCDRRREKAQGDRPRRHRRRQHRHPVGHRPRHRGHEHAVRQLHHHGRARHRPAVRRRPPDRRGGCLHAGGEVGKEPLHGRRALCQDPRPHRLRQHRRAGRGTRAGAQDEGDRLRSLPLARARRQARRGESRAGRSAGACRCDFTAHAADRQDQEHPLGGRRSRRPNEASSS